MGNQVFPVFEMAFSELSVLRGECDIPTGRQSEKSGAVRRIQEEVRE